MMAEESKRAKSQHEKEDRISALPDSLIQHILSLLPSTKEAVQTSILSKRWHHQWTRVASLIFSNSGMSDQSFSRFIDNTLLLLDSSSKIQKFHILSENYEIGNDPTVFSKLHFAIRKGVEDLRLEFKTSESEFCLPDFIFKHTSLVKLQLHDCQIVTDGVVSWDRLKELIIDNSTLSDTAIEDILLGSPSLESLHLSEYYGLFSLLKIASKYLKRMVLVFNEDEFCEFKICCPKLEELKLLGNLDNISIEFEDLSSLVCATLNFGVSANFEGVIRLLQQLQHVKELTFGSKFLDILAEIKRRGFHLDPLLRIKSLTLDHPDFKRHSAGILQAFGILPLLEKLVIKDSVYEAAELSTSECFDWKRSAPNSLVPCLKTVHIVGLKKSSECEVPLEFVGFLLKNSPVMEKLVMLKDS